MRIGNANPRGIFQARVYGFDGLQTGYPCLIMSVQRAYGTVQLVVTCQRQTRESRVVDYKLRSGRRLDGSWK